MKEAREQYKYVSFVISRIRSKISIIILLSYYNNIFLKGNHNYFLSLFYFQKLSTDITASL